MKNLAPNDLVCDYATPKNLDSIVAAGYKAVARYIVGNFSDWRSISMAERNAILAKGLGLWLIWETGASKALSGAAGGTADGIKAKRDAAALDYNGTIIIATTDFDVTGGNVKTVMEYCRAFKVACGLPCGIYGDTDVAQAISPGEFLIWRPAASWWSRFLGKNFVHPNTDIKQGATSVKVPGVDHGIVLKPVSAWTGKVPTKPQVVPDIPKPDLKLTATSRFVFNPEVLKLQKIINFWGAHTNPKFTAGPEDGKFGATTKTGVIAFQKMLKVKADGWYGVETANTYKALTVFLASLKK